MAYFIGTGDTVQTSYIARTLDAKLYIRDGVTTNDEIKIPNAETVLYWTKEHKSGNATVNKPGARQEFDAKALKKHMITVEKAEQLSGVIPGVNIGTVSADTVNAYVVDGTVEAANRINRDFLAVLEKDAAAKTVAGSDIYEKILDLRAQFIKVNGTPTEDTEKVEEIDGVEVTKKIMGKPASYLEPTAMFVSPKVMAALKAKNLVVYKDNDIMGSFLDMAIIEAPNLTNDVVMLNKIAMVSGISFNATKTFDGSYLGYADGVAYIGEIAYVNAKTELDENVVCVPVMAVASV